MKQYSRLALFIVVLSLWTLPVMGQSDIADPIWITATTKLDSLAGSVSIHFDDEDYIYLFSTASHVSIGHSFHISVLDQNGLVLRDTVMFNQLGLAHSERITEDVLNDGSFYLHEIVEVGGTRTTLRGFDSNFNPLWGKYYPADLDISITSSQSIRKDSVVLITTTTVDTLYLGEFSLHSGNLIKEKAYHNYDGHFVNLIYVTDDAVYLATRPSSFSVNDSVRLEKLSTDLTPIWSKHYFVDPDFAKIEYISSVNGTVVSIVSDDLPLPSNEGDVLVVRQLDESTGDLLWVDSISNVQGRIFDNDVLTDAHLDSSGIVILTSSRDLANPNLWHLSKLGIEGDSLYMNQIGEGMLYRTPRMIVDNDKIIVFGTNINNELNISTYNSASGNLIETSNVDAMSGRFTDNIVLGIQNGSLYSGLNATSPVTTTGRVYVLKFDSIITTGVSQWNYPELEPLQCNLSPNPSTGIVQISCSSNISEISISNVSGNVLLKKSLPQKMMSSELNLQGLLPGMYFCTITTQDNKQMSLKLLLVK